MFNPKTYTQRRTLLKKSLKSGIALFLGNEESPMNYPANTYAFRQDSSFLYFFALNTPGLAAVVDIEAGTDTVFGDDITLEDVIWMGELPKIKDRAAAAGVFLTAPLSKLEETVAEARKRSRPIHYLPPYRAESLARLSGLLGGPPQEIKKNVSVELIKAVVAQRSTKSEEEIAEMEKALAVTHKMYLSGMTSTRPGLYESDVVAVVDTVGLSRKVARLKPLGVLKG